MSDAMRAARELVVRDNEWLAGVDFMKDRKMSEAGQTGACDVRAIANGLFHDGFDANKMSATAKDEVRQAVDALLRVWDMTKARHDLALEQLDKAATELTRLQQSNAEKDAKIAELEERAHYAKGVAELAMKHRDAAEQSNAALVEELGKQAQIASALRQDLQEAVDTFADDTRYPNAMKRWNKTLDDAELIIDAPANSDVAAAFNAKLTLAQSAERTSVSKTGD